MIKLLGAEPTPYERLGVRRDASEASIAKTWRKLALKHHPDRCGVDGGFELLVHARDQISDAQRRAEYDAELTAAIGAGTPPKLSVERDAAAQALCHADDDLPVVAVCSVSFLSPDSCSAASDSASTDGLGIWVGSASTSSELGLRVIECLNQRAVLVPMRLVLSGARGSHGCARLRALDSRLLAVASMLAPTLVLEAPCQGRLADAFKSSCTDAGIFSDELAWLLDGLGSLQSQQVSVPWPRPTVTVVRAVEGTPSDTPSASISTGFTTSDVVEHGADPGGHEVTLELTQDEIASLSAHDGTIPAGAGTASARCSTELRPLERALLLIGAGRGTTGSVVGGVCTRLLGVLPLRLNILSTNSSSHTEGNAVVSTGKDARSGPSVVSLGRAHIAAESGCAGSKAACIRSLPPLESSSGMWEPSYGRLHVGTTLLASLAGAAVNAASGSTTCSAWVGSAVALRDAVDSALAVSCRDHVTLCASVYSDIIECVVEGVHSVEADDMRAAHERALVAALCRLVVFESGLGGGPGNQGGVRSASRAAEAITQLVHHAEQEYALFCAANALAQGQDHQGPRDAQTHVQPHAKADSQNEVQKEEQEQEQSQVQGREQTQELAQPETQEQTHEQIHEQTQEQTQKQMMAMADKRFQAAELARIGAEEQAKSYVAAANAAQSQVENMRARAERAEHELLMLRKEADQLREQLAAQRSRDIEQIQTGLEADAQSLARKQETLDSIQKTLRQIDVQQREGAVEARRQRVATSERIDEAATTAAAAAAAAAAAETSIESTAVARTRAPWVDNRDAARCWQCSKEFGLLVRRHHCRACGAVFCGKCSSSRTAIPARGYEEAVRVCDKCYDGLQQQQRDRDGGDAKVVTQSSQGADKATQ